MADWLTTWSVWHWLVLGFVLLIAETLVPGVFLLWWGLAAIVTAGVMALVPSLSLTALAIFYAILAIILSLLWWKYQHSKDNQDQSRTTLNQRDHTLLGKKGSAARSAMRSLFACPRTFRREAPVTPPDSRWEF